MGTKSGDESSRKYNEVIRVATIEHAILGQLRNPPKGFEIIVKTHFYIKQHEVLKVVDKWIEEGKNSSSHHQKLCKLMEELKKELSLLTPELLEEKDEQEEEDED